MNIENIAVLIVAGAWIGGTSLGIYGLVKWKGRRMRALALLVSSLVIPPVIGGAILSELGENSGRKGADVATGTSGAVDNEKTEPSKGEIALKMSDRRQADLCNTVSVARLAAEDAEGNAIAEAENRKDRRTKVPPSLIAATSGANTDPPFFISAWVGELEEILPLAGDSYAVTVALDCDAQLRAVSDTAVQQWSSVIRTLRGLKEGQKVAVSGTFVPGGENDLDKGYPFREMSITEAGALREPEFQFRFGAIVPVEDREALALADMGEDGGYARLDVRAEIARVEEERANCRESLQCWAEKHSAAATVKCTPLIGKMAKYDVEWGSMFDPMFSHMRWKDAKAGTIVFIGDKVKFQNGFGVWIPVTYQCEYDPINETVLDIQIEEGRF